MKIERYLYWLPRILGIIYILFLAIFALDVFIPGKTIGYYLIALFMHLIPNFVVLALLLFSWKYEKIGGIIFILLGVFSLFLIRTNGFFLNYVLISFPIFSIGILLLLHYRMGVKEK
jgi:hypothetical protein